MTPVSDVADRARATEPQTEAKPGRSNPNIPSGIVPGVRRPAGMVPLRVVAGEAEKTDPLLFQAAGRGGPTLSDQGPEGKLYLQGQRLCYQAAGTRAGAYGRIVHLDPLYAVGTGTTGSSRWNSVWRLPRESGSRPAEGAGPKVEQPADKDPRRDFLHGHRRHRTRSRPSRRRPAGIRFGCGPTSPGFGRRRHPGSAFRSTQRYTPSRTWFASRDDADTFWVTQKVTAG